MEDLVDKLGWKKLAAIMIVVSVLFIIFVVVSSLNLPSGNEQTSEAEPAPTSTTDSGTSQPSNANTKKGKTLSYKNSLYSLEYPDSLGLTVEQISEPGDSIVLKSDVKNERIGIQIYDAGTSSVGRLSQVFDAFGYASGSAVVSSVPAVEYKGILSGANVPLRENAVIFEHNGKTYKIQLSYISAVFDPAIENRFSQIVGSFSLF